jgi:methylthioribulose-1-phosphate dehydratase
MLATGGNLSARTGSVGFMTASGGHKGRLQAENFLRWELGHALPDSPKPSAEAPVHVAIYTARPQTAAVVHVHSPYATLVSREFADAGEVTFEGFEFIKALGFWDDGAVVRVPVVPNHASIPMLAAAVAGAISDTPVVLVSGHGVYAWGDSIAAAHRHVEATEFLSQMVWERTRATRA